MANADPSTKKASGWDDLDELGNKLREKYDKDTKRGDAVCARHHHRADDQGPTAQGAHRGLADADMPGAQARNSEKNTPRDASCRTRSGFGRQVDDLHGSADDGVEHVARHNYPGLGLAELEVSVGDVLVNVVKLDGNWRLGAIHRDDGRRKRVGIFPAIVITDQVERVEPTPPPTPTPSPTPALSDDDVVMN
ncbi:uncharacterized protein PG986_008577 [Apiospora aurea]|uniref:SH3 domain-containing protein n=1 Tax=Apiospora aurea TaxID=335848 RepID=A0ABR1QFU9_9PEZI